MGETALWMPKSGFPHSPFRESNKVKMYISYKILH